MKILTLLITLMLTPVHAQEEPDRYPEYIPIAEQDAHFWQLTLVTQTEMIDVDHAGGFGFYSRVSCIKDGMRRMQDALVEHDEDWKNSPLLGFVCEYTAK